MASNGAPTFNEDEAPIVEHEPNQFQVEWTIEKSERISHTYGKRYTSTAQTKLNEHENRRQRNYIMNLQQTLISYFLLFTAWDAK